MKKKSIKPFDEFLDENPKFKKKFEKEFKKYTNRPKPNRNKKIGFSYLKKNFNLDLFLKQIEKNNYKYMDEGTMLDRIIQYGFKQDEVDKIYDHLNYKEFEKLKTQKDYYKLLLQISNNFKIIDCVEEQAINKLVSISIIYSKKNTTYYLFVDEMNFADVENYEGGSTGNCLYFKSNNVKSAENEMFKIIQEIEKNSSKKSLN